MGFRRAGIALPQSLATAGWARLGVPPCPLTLLQAPVIVALVLDSFTPQAGCGMKAGSSAKRISPTPSAAHSVTAKRRTKNIRPRGKSTRLFVVTLSGSARPCWRRRSRASPNPNGQEAFPGYQRIRRLRRSSRTFRCVFREREQRLIKKIDEALGEWTRTSMASVSAVKKRFPIRDCKARPVTTLCINCKTLEEQEEKVRR